MLCQEGWRENKMELGTLLFLLIFFGLISFVIEKIWGFNPYKMFIIIGAITLFFSFLYILFPVMFNSSDLNSVNISIDRLTSWLINFLPGALIGDIAGVIISKLTGENRG